MLVCCKLIDHLSTERISVLNMAHIRGMQFTLLVVKYKASGTDGIDDEKTIYPDCFCVHINTRLYL